MKRIERLVERVRKLKVRKASAALVRVLSSHDKDVTNSLETFETVSSGIQASEAVFGEGGARASLTPCTTAFSGASRAANRIVEVIRAHPERTPEARIGDGVSDIKAHAKEAQQAITSFWKSAIDDRCKLAEATADIASAGFAESHRGGSFTSTVLPLDTDQARSVCKRLFRSIGLVT